MKKYLSENPTIAFGLGLPLLLVILFLMVSGIPRLIVDPPVHDVIYMTNSHNNLQIAVVNTKVQVTSHGHLGYNNKPRLWRYIAKTGAVQELAVILPANRNIPLTQVATTVQKILLVVFLVALTALYPL